MTHLIRTKKNVSRKRVLAQKENLSQREEPKVRERILHEFSDISNGIGCLPSEYVNKECIHLHIVSVYFYLSCPRQATC